MGFFGIKTGCIKLPEAPQEEQPALPRLIYCHSVIGPLQVVNNVTPHHHAEQSGWLLPCGVLDGLREVKSVCVSNK